MQRIFVTGSTGFIGKHLVSLLLDQQREVTCLVRDVDRARTLLPRNVRLVQGTIEDPERLQREIRGHDAVAHLAGLTKAFRSADLFRVNAEGTRNVAIACAAQPNPPALVYVSSLAAAGPAIHGRPRTESDEPAPVSRYGQSKLAGEMCVRELAGELPATILRPTVVLGEGDVDGKPLFEGIAWSGILVVPAMRDFLFSVVHASDVARAVEFALQNGEHISGTDRVGTFFVAADEQITYGGLGRLIAEAMGRPRAHIIHSPKWTVWPLAATCELVARVRRKPYVMNFDKAREAVAGAWACDNRALKQHGFSYPVPLKQRLRQTIEWYWQQGWIPRVKPKKTAPSLALSTHSQDPTKGDYSANGPLAQ